MASGKILLVAVISNVYVLLGASEEPCEPNQTIAHPDNLSKFFICDAEGDFRMFSCPEGLYFNPSKPGCDPPLNGEEEEGYKVEEEDEMMGHPAEEMAHEVPYSDPLMENSQSLNSETYEASYAETVYDKHFMEKRDINDPEVKDWEPLTDSNAHFYGLYSTHRENPPLPIETDEFNMTQSDILKLQDSLLSLFYLLSSETLSGPLHEENKTEHNNDHLGYFIKENNDTSGEYISHDSHHGETNIPHEDQEDDLMRNHKHITTDEKEKSSDGSGFLEFYK